MPSQLDLGRLKRGEAVAAASGLVLFVVMFLPWFSEQERVEGPGIRPFDVAQETHSAWQSLGAGGVLLVLVILLALGVALLRAAELGPEDPVLPPALFVCAAGLLAVIVILYRLVSPPDPTIDLAVGEADVGRSFGIVLGLMAATGISLGGYLTLAEGQAARRSR